MRNGVKRTICTLGLLLVLSGPAHSEPRANPKSTQDQRTIVVPYMAVGGALEGWHFLTVLSLENSDRRANAGTIEFFSAEGRPLHVQLDDNAGLAARGEWKVSGKNSRLIVVSHPGGSFENGWLRIRLTGKSPIKVVVLVQCYNGEHLFAQAGTVAHPGEAVNGPYYRISAGGSGPWTRWKESGAAPRIALLGPIGAGQRSVEDLASAAQALSTGNCARSPETGASSGVGIFQEMGFASWYGDEYHGRISSSGAVYDQWTLTAAHRTLPFGTSVRITNLRNGCSVKVRIADRGPFVPGRIVDLSTAAARRIDLMKEGVSRVRLETIPS